MSAPQYKRDFIMVLGHKVSGSNFPSAKAWRQYKAGVIQRQAQRIAAAEQEERIRIIERARLARLQTIHTQHFLQDRLERIAREQQAQQQAQEMARLRQKAVSRESKRQAYIAKAASIKYAENLKVIKALGTWKQQTMAVSTKKYNKDVIIRVAGSLDTLPNHTDAVLKIVKQAGKRYFVMVEFADGGRKKYVPVDPSWTEDNVSNMLAGDEDLKGWNKKPDHTLRDLLKHYNRITALYFYVYSGVHYAPDFNLWHSTDLNCMLTIIEDCEKVKKVLEAKPKIAQKYIEFKENLSGGPMTKAKVETISKMFQLRLVIHSPANMFPWFETGIDHWRKIDIFASYDHASVYQPLQRVDKVVIMNPNILGKLYQPAIYHMVGSPVFNDGDLSNLVTAVHVGDTLYKSFMPSSVSGVLADNDDPRFMSCKTKASFMFKKWVAANGLRPLEAPYFEIFENADRHFSSQKFIDTLPGESFPEADMHRAFTSYEKYPLYEKYGICTGNVTMYAVTHKNQAEVLGYNGVSHIRAIRYFNDFFMSLGFLHAGQCYSNAEIFTCVSNGWCVVDIDWAVICREPVKLSLPFIKDDPSMDPMEIKLYNNSIVGRLIAGADPKMRERHVICSARDTVQVKHEMMTDLECQAVEVWPVKSREWGGRFLVTGTYQPKPAQGQLHHVHLSILALQRCVFIEALVNAASMTKIISYNTDGFHYMPHTHILPEHLGFFRASTKQIKYSSTKKPMVHNILKWRPTREIRPFVSDYTIHPRTMTSGPAGCGKSYLFKKYPDPSSVMLVPNNNIMVNVRRDAVDANVMTYHKFMKYKSAFQTQTLFENIVVDEVSMIPAGNLYDIMEFCKARRVNLDLIGDVIMSIGPKMELTYRTPQREPPGEAERCIDKTYDDVYKNFEWMRADGPFKRQENDEEYKWLCTLAYMDEYHQHKAIMERCGPIVQMNPREFITSGMMGVAPVHRGIKKFNDEIISVNELTTVLARRAYTKRTKLEILPKGQLSMQPIEDVWCERVHSAQEYQKEYECAYFRTSDALQGDPIEVPYYIDMRESPVRGFLYTAMTRCRRLSQIRLVDSSLDFEGECLNPCVREPEIISSEGLVLPEAGQLWEPSSKYYTSFVKKCEGSAWKAINDMERRHPDTYLVIRNEAVEIHDGLEVTKNHYRVYKDQKAFKKDWHKDRRFCIHEIIGSNRVQRLKCDLDNYGHDNDIHAVVWAMNAVLEGLKTSGHIEGDYVAPMIRVSISSGVCSGPDGLYWKRSAHLRVENYCVSNCEQAKAFTDLVRSSKYLPSRLRNTRVYDNIDTANRSWRLPYSWKGGRRLMPLTDDGDWSAHTITSCPDATLIYIPNAADQKEVETLAGSMEVAAKFAQDHPMEMLGWTPKCAKGSRVYLTRGAGALSNCGLCTEAHTGADNYKCLVICDGSVRVGCTKSGGRTREAI